MISFPLLKSASSPFITFFNVPSCKKVYYKRIITEQKAASSLLSCPGIFLQAQSGIKRFSSFKTFNAQIRPSLDLHGSVFMV